MLSQQEPSREHPQQVSGIPDDSKESHKQQHKPPYYHGQKNDPQQIFAGSTQTPPAGAFRSQDVHLKNSPRQEDKRKYNYGHGNKMTNLNPQLIQSPHRYPATPNSMIQPQYQNFPMNPQMSAGIPGQRSGVQVVDQNPSAIINSMQSQQPRRSFGNETNSQNKRKKNTRGDHQNTGMTGGGMGAQRNLMYQQQKNPQPHPSQQRPGAFNQYPGMPPHSQSQGIQPNPQAQAHAQATAQAQAQAYFLGKQMQFPNFQLVGGQGAPVMMPNEGNYPWGMQLNEQLFNQMQQNERGQMNYQPIINSMNSVNINKGTLYINNGKEGNDHAITKLTLLNQKLEIDLKMQKKEYEKKLADVERHYKNQKEKEEEINKTTLYNIKKEYEEKEARMKAEIEKLAEDLKEKNDQALKWTKELGKAYEKIDEYEKTLKEGEIPKIFVEKGKTTLKEENLIVSRPDFVTEETKEKGDQLSDMPKRIIFELNPSELEAKIKKEDKEKKPQSCPIRSPAADSQGGLSPRSVREEKVSTNSEITPYVKETFFVSKIQRVKLEELRFKYNFGVLPTEMVYDLLDKEVKEFAHYVELAIRTSRPVRDSLIEKLGEIVGQSFPESDIKVYGSYATNLCLPWSDIDLVIDHKDPNWKYQSAKTIDDFAGLHNSLEKTSWVEDIQLIKTASMPVMKIVCKGDFAGLRVDITAKDSRHKGIECVKMIKEFKKEYPQLEPLVLVLKYILRSGELNDPYHGGLSSYALILMVVAYFQNYPSGVKSDNLGYLLLDILMFYSYMDISTMAIAPYRIPAMSMNRVVFPPIMIDREFSATIPHIFDPLVENNNVGKSSFRFCEVQSIFSLIPRSCSIDCLCTCHKTDIQKSDAYANSELHFTDKKHSLISHMCAMACVFSENSYKTPGFHVFK